MNRTKSKIVGAFCVVLCAVSTLNAHSVTIRCSMIDPPEVVKIETDADNKKNPSQAIDKLFDGNLNTKWFADGGPEKGYPCFIKWDYKTEIKINSYTLVSANDVPARDPKSWKLYGYDGGKYVLVDEQTDVTFAGRKESKTFSLKKPGTYKSFKLEILGVAAGSANTPPQLAEIELNNGVSKQQPQQKQQSTVSTKRPLTIAHSKIESVETDCDNKKNANQSVDKLFDGSMNTKWFADGGPDKGYPCFIAWDYKTDQTISSYTLTSGNDSPGRDPKSWKLYGYDGKNYVLIDQQSNAVFDDRKQSKKFKLKKAATYKTFKFEILGVAADNTSTPPQLTGIELD